jgi:hypothetical protein
MFAFEKQCKSTAEWPLKFSPLYAGSCVVLAENSNEGGVQTRFLALLNQGLVLEEFVACENSKNGNLNHQALQQQGSCVHDPTQEIPLKKWLHTAPC